MNTDQLPETLLAADTAAREVVPLQTSEGNALPPHFAVSQNQQELHARTALENFFVLLRGMDFAFELQLLGVKRVLFWRRRRMRTELRALTIGLWRLALERSFPEHCQRIFDAFLERWLDDIDDEDKANAFAEKVRNYLSLLEVKRDANFSEVGAHLVSLLKLPEKDAVALRLRLALHIRSLYTLVFDRLI